MKNLKFEIFFNKVEPENDYRPKVGQKMARISCKGREYDTIVQNDEYGEYIVVPNYLNSRSEGFFWSNISFNRRIKDAVETIRNGDGDVLSVTNLLTSTDSVHYYLDRDVGESLRNKFIKGWEDSEFNTLVFRNGSMCGSYLTEDGHLIPTLLFDSDIDERFKTKENIRYFESEEEAEQVIQEIYAKSEEMIKAINEDNSVYLSLTDDLLNASFNIIVDVDEDDSTKGLKVDKSLRVIQELKKKEA